MAVQKTKEAALRQNLADAGCDEKTILQCLALWKKDRITDMLLIFTSHRAVLLEAVHREQDKLDCLDYLIHQTKRS